jgi:8-oxo-dGTP pyrophosphatase MutT (NUDIX family)
MTDSHSEQWTRDRLNESIKKHHCVTYSWASLSSHPFNQLVKAAVLVPLTIIDNSVELWLTERSQFVRHDKGHVAFPGGMKDPCDIDAVHTSLREAEEEIGLQPDQVCVTHYVAENMMSSPCSLQYKLLFEISACLFYEVIFT